MRKRIKVLVAKPGLDGHDRGAKVVAIALTQAGMEVMYTGLHRSLDAIVQTAIEEDVDVIGLSIMTGGHLPITRKLTQMLKNEGLDDVLLCVGGVIPRRDVEKLKELGVEGVFPGGTKLEDAITFIKDHVGAESRR